MLKKTRLNKKQLELPEPKTSLMRWTSLRQINSRNEREENQLWLIHRFMEYSGRVKLLRRR